MRLLAAFAVGFGAMTALPAWAQPKIAPSREYSTTPPAGLDKNFGLPTFGMPGAELPQQRTQAPKPAPKTDPDFFAPPPVADAETSGTPDFFSTTTDLTVPRAPRSKPGTASAETPLFTTGQGYSTGEMPANRLETDDTPKGDRSDDP
ncbi:MAG TPA: hypothetical protein DDZ81_05530 [Acetobacteraceae bacterium]|jgi:hypothetical protein|nr:hypothetical protein [Acetobacteraceae bacterium]